MVENTKYWGGIYPNNVYYDKDHNYSLQWSIAYLKNPKIY